MDFLYIEELQYQMLNLSIAMTFLFTIINEIIDFAPHRPLHLFWEDFLYWHNILHCKAKE